MRSLACSTTPALPTCSPGVRSFRPRARPPSSRLFRRCVAHLGTHPVTGSAWNTAPRHFVSQITQMTHSIQSTVDIRRADTRFATDAGWLESRHCFSFARHYDPSNTHHGLLLVSNDDIV